MPLLKPPNRQTANPMSIYFYLLKEVKTISKAARYSSSPFVAGWADKNSLSLSLAYFISMKMPEFYLFIYIFSRTS